MSIYDVRRMSLQAEELGIYFEVLGFKLNSER